MGDAARHFFEKGWLRFPADPAISAWVEASLPACRAAVAAPANAHWLRCAGTWFAGVNVLPNGSDGALEDGPPLDGAAVDFIARELGLSGFAWDRAQVSVCYPGYPQPREGESDAAYRYRRDRDAAHLDGLLPEGEARRRHLREHHGFLLGLPMVETPEGASPFVLWEGSHELVRARFAELYAAARPEDWGEIDVTEPYHALRRDIFAACPRLEIRAKPGEAFLVHRLMLHGVAPWRSNEVGPPEGRMVVYFRPDVLSAAEWLRAP